MKWGLLRTIRFKLSDGFIITLLKALDNRQIGSDDEGLQFSHRFRRALARMNRDRGLLLASALRMVRTPNPE